MKDSDTYQDKVLGCWLGKSLGGTIGGPLEGKCDWLDIPSVYPDVNIENDDLELQLLWIHVMNQRGVNVTSQDLVEEGWSKLVYPFDEYGVAVANLALGLTPPATGHYNNRFSDCMGSPIRSEIWACVYPDQPAKAAWFALQDAQVDHWGEGVYGEIFFAVLESMAFSRSDLKAMIRDALSYITPDCKVYESVEMTLAACETDASVKEIRQQILDTYEDANFTHAIQNIAFTVLGLLRGGGDLLESILVAARCGYDTDCTAATAGAVIGLNLGGDAVRKNAQGRLAENVVLGWGVDGITAPANVTELTEATARLALEAERNPEIPELEKGYRLPPVPDYVPPMPVPVLQMALDRRAELSSLDFSEAECTENPGAEIKLIPASGKPYLYLLMEFDLSDGSRVKGNPFANVPVRLWIDGELRVETSHALPVIPAPHRSDWEGNSVPGGAFELTRGLHRAVIELMVEDEPNPDLFWILSDAKNNWVTGIRYRSPEGIPASI